MADDNRFCNNCGADSFAAGAQPTQAIDQDPLQYYGQGGPVQNEGYAQQYDQMGVVPGAGFPNDPNDPNNPYYYGDQVDEREARRAAKAQMKEAKAAYKDARKAAGKSNAPKVIAIIVGVLVVAGLAVGLTLFFMGQSNSTSASDENSSKAGAGDGSSVQSGSASSSESVLSASSGSSAVASSTASGAAGGTGGTGGTGSAVPSTSAQGADQVGLASLKGTWKGTFTGQSRYSGHHCWRAESDKLSLDLTITEVSTSGRIAGTADVLFHGHGSVDRSDSDGEDGDRVFRVVGVGTLDSGGFEWSGESPDHDGSITIKFEIDDNSNGRKLRAYVTSEFGLTTFVDEYELVKQ